MPYVSKKHNKRLAIFESKEISSYGITKKHNIIGQATWKKIHENGHIDTRTIEALCKYLDCQPADLMKYVPNKSVH